LKLKILGSSPNLVGEEGPRIQEVKWLLSNDFIIVLSVFSTSAILERMLATTLLVCNVK